MKISIVITDITRRGGTEKATFNLLAGLLNKGVEAKVISLFKESSYTQENSEKISYLVSGGYDISHGKLYRIKRLLQAIRKFRSFERKQPGDVIYVGQAFLPSLVLWLSGVSKRSVACEHFKFDLYGKLVTKIRNRIYSHFRRVVTLTDSACDAYRSEGIDAVTIPNMIPNVQTEPVRTKEKRLITAGRFSHEKGFDMLLHAMVKVKEKHPDWYLDIYGEGVERDALIQLAEELELGDSVRFNKFSTNLYKELSDSDIYVLPSRHEGLPMVMLEAMACRVSIVSFACSPGPVSLLEDGCGSLVTPGDAEALGYEICRMIENPDMRKVYVANAYRKSEEYSPEKVIEKWMGVLES